MIITFRLLLIACLSVITWLALTDRPMPEGVPTWDKANHLMAFLLLAFLADNSFPDIERHWIKWLALLAYGFGLECLQWLTEYRYFELADVFTDGLGIGIYWVIRPWIAKIRATINTH